MYSDKTDEFHRLVLAACNKSEVSPGVAEAILDETPTAGEERVHEKQTEMSHTVLGTMQATETIESP